MKLYALLIGINEYSPASVSSIRSLQACLNDVARIRTFLTTHYSDCIADESQLLTLTNARATRENVINGFNTHLTQAKEGDVALVFYSGHGSYGVTAPEFQKFTTDREEQTWVLHDSREEGKYDLSDKEIALLLETVGRKKPHLVVIADSCHSGSVTRDVEDFKQMLPRFTSGTAEPRPLETYLNGAYTQRPDLGIPASTHLLMAACERKERAWEADGQGQFTKALLKVLEKNGGRIQYADLFVQVRAAIKSDTDNQTPQLETIGDISARQGFLGKKTEAGVLRRYRTFFDKNKGQWKIELGADQGLAPNLGSALEVKLFEETTGGERVGEANIGALGLSNSEIQLQQPLDKNKTYWGEPTQWPLMPFFVYGNRTAMTVMKSVLDQAAETGIQWMNQPEACLVEIAVKDDTILVYDTRTRVMVQGVRGTDSDAALQALEILQKLARWHRLLALTNPTSKIEAEALEMVIKVQKDNRNYDCTDPVLTLDFDGEAIPFEAVLTNKTAQKLYAALLYQSPDYGIQVLYENSQPLAPQGVVTLVENIFVLDDENNEETDTFKLLVSTEPIDTFLFQQEALEIGAIASNAKGLGRGIGTGTKSDWLTKTTTVRIVRKGTQVAGQEPIRLGKGIEIQPHPSFRGNVNWIPLVPKTRSVTELAIQNDYFRSNPYLRIVPLEEGAKDTDDKSILEIGDMLHQETLRENPLVVTVPYSDEEELTLPLFFDGEDFLPLGKATLDEHGRLRFEITQIPEEKGPAKTRSLSSALRMVAVKFANKLGFAGETHQLRWVDYSNADKAERTSDGLEEKIAEAKKVLLLVHGIIGDTEDMAKTFRLAMAKGYDLVLTYDYENLNTPIEENARILKEKLLTAGFGKDDSKELVLVVHSMGGLVTRYMIERLGGEALVDKLIMAGTPNGGSKFGNVPDYLNWAAMALGVGAKLFPPQAGAVAGFASGLLKGFTKVLLPALGQMNVGSPFIVDLAAGNPPPIPYVVFGGDLEAYLTANNGIALMEKAVAQIGEWVYKDVKNDIAVSVDNIFKVRNTPTHELPCHHLNYFVVPESVKALEGAL
ncbi:MAG: caspase family protein [Spirosomataceae bacterium]